MYMYKQQLTFLNGQSHREATIISETNENQILSHYQKFSTTNKNSPVKGNMMAWSDEQSIRKMLEFTVWKRATYLLQGGHFYTVVGSIYGRINIKNHGSNFYVPVPYKWIWIKPTLFSCSFCNQQSSSIFCTLSFKHKINNITDPS